MSAIRNFALVAAATAALAGSTQAQDPLRHDHGRGNRIGAFRDLNLTEAQKTQIQAIHTKYQTQFKTSREQAKPFMEAARAARQKGDTAAFRSNMEKAHQLMSAVQEQERNEIRAVLTPEQRAKADSAMARRPLGPGMRPGGPGGPRGPRGFRGEGPLPGPAFRDLNLTDAQKTQMKAIRTKYQAQAKTSREQEMNEIRAVLTPEQRAKLDARIAERKERRGRR